MLDIVSAFRKMSTKPDQAQLNGVFVYWRRHKRLEDRAQALTTLIEDRDTQLRETDYKLKRLAGLDSVTEIANHSHFQEFLRSEWRRALREASSISVIMVDLDHLKDYNDEFGYPGGDECLKHVAKAFSESIGRPGDLVARYGGGEFGVVLSRTDTEGAFRVAHKMCAPVEALAITHPRSPIAGHVTVSLGLRVPHRRWTRIGKSLNCSPPPRAHSSRPSRPAATGSSRVPPATNQQPL